MIKDPTFCPPVVVHNNTTIPPTAGEYNQEFITQENIIEAEIQQYRDENPTFWSSRVNFPQGQFVYGEGYMKKRQIFHGMPGVQDWKGDLWTEMQQSQGADPGPMHDSCRPTSSARVHWGFEEKSYEPYELILSTDSFCVTDLKFKWQYEQQMALIYNSLSQISTQISEDWNRDTYIELSTIVPAVPGFMNWAQAPGVIPNPTQMQVGVLTQGFLDKIYSSLSRTARKFALNGGSGMKPQFGLVTSEETSNHVIVSDPEQRKDFRENMGEYNIDGLGTELTYRNWVHMHDPFVPRFVLNEAGDDIVRVWPWSEEAATIGSKWNVSPEYLNAPYELSIVYMQDVFTNLVLPQVGSIGAAEFDPNSYVGMPKWISILNEETNRYGENGNYDMRFQMAAKPGLTDHSLCILHKTAGTSAEYVVNTVERGLSEPCDPCEDTPDTNIVSWVQDFCATPTLVTVTLTAAIADASNGDTVVLTLEDGFKVDAVLATGETTTAITLTVPASLDVGASAGLYHIVKK